MTAKNYYVIKYKACEAECPSYISGKFNQTKFEWSVFETKPNDATIKNNYEFTITNREIKNLEFDFYGSQTIFVSGKFLELCGHLDVKFRAVPLKFILKKKPLDKEYYIFLPVDHLPLMNKKLSTFTAARKVESGEMLISKLYPDQVLYNDITEFVVSNHEFPHVFQCTEIRQLVCTGEFMQLAKERGLNCLDFMPIDANFKYDPWAIASR